MQKILIYILCLFFSLNFYSQNNSKKIKNSNLENGVAIKGYDAVAYFTQNKAIKGNKKFSVNVDGVIYYCTSQANKDLLIKTPEKYEPQYGGWCAYAMGAKNTKVEIDPETFKVKDEKLYLFYNKGFTNTLPLWNKDESNLKTKADINWKKILSN